MYATAAAIANEKIGKGDKVNQKILTGKTEYKK